MIKIRIKNRTGEKNHNNFGSEIIISKYIDCYNVDIYFPKYNWTAKNREYKNFKEGNVKCPYEPRIFGKAYLGEIGEKINLKKEKSYEIWHNILQRCFDIKYKEKHPTYKDCIISDEWLNYTNFYYWYKENYYEIPNYNKRMAIDKDILMKGNKIYSSEFCRIIPEDINILFAKNDKLRGKYPIGVYYNEESNKYCVSIRKYGKQYNLGRYNSPIKAFNIYKQEKEKYIKEVADKYKEWIPKEIYDAMYKYEVEITD